MSRAHLRFTVKDVAGNVVQNALVYVYNRGTVVAVSDMYAGSSGGSPISTLTSNAQGEIEAWFTYPKFVDLKVTDNSDAAYYPTASSEPLSFSDFTETVEAMTILGGRSGPDSPDAIDGGPGQNTWGGYLALSSVTTGNNPNTGTAQGTLTAFGHQAMKAATTAQSCEAFGWNALLALTTGIQNVAVGTAALSKITTSNNNTGLGFNALYEQTSGANNTAVGYAAGYLGTTRSRLAALGYSAAYGTKGNDNTALGSSAMGSTSTTQTGVENTAVGSSAMRELTTGSANVAIGYTAFLDVTTGSNNVAIGQSALWAPNGVGANKSLVGIGNTAVGYQTGCDSTADPNYMTLLGYRALGGAAYALALGANANALASGSVAIGTDSTSAGATTSVANEIKLGTANHSVKVLGKINSAATASGQAGLNIPHGTAPSSPVNGDLWTTTAGLYVRINGATVGPLS